MSWAKVAKKDKLPETPKNTEIEKKPTILTTEVNTQEDKPIYFPNRFERVQEKYKLEILDAFHAVEEEVRKGIYGYVFSEYSHYRGTEFINIVNRHIDYNYYKRHGYVDNERYAEDSLSGSEEEHYWGEKRNKFAYV